MYMLAKHLAPLGFKGSGFFESQFQDHFYLEIPEIRRIVIVNNLEPQAITYFDLSEDQYEKFKSNKLGLVPLGCVSVSARPCLYEQEIAFKGDFRKFFVTRKKVLAFIKVLMEK